MKKPFFLNDLNAILYIYIYILGGPPGSLNGASRRKVEATKWPLYPLPPPGPSGWKFLRAFTQQYPPGTQENYNSFSSRNPITEKGKELEYPEGAGGGKGEPGGSPYIYSNKFFYEKFTKKSWVPVGTC